MGRLCALGRDDPTSDANCYSDGPVCTLHGQLHGWQVPSSAQLTHGGQ